ncbi:MAG: hypothetical protein A2Z52_02495 [Candidatus Moranbacteria bacterium RBG_19FT_COMBO_42_6]|nr:MAG: hypothetical protein A2Z52_02495 [Candidatus Moranbacteria bacterium RBG_19FT_COMBO_42_6]
MDKKGEGFWWHIYWNLANIISISRLISIFTVLFLTDWSIRAKLLLYVILESTDALDGPVARKVKNNNGIGRIIDPAVDKLDKFFVLIFFFYSACISNEIIGAIMLGESFVLVIAFYGSYFIFKHHVMLRKKPFFRLSRLELREILSHTKKEMLQRGEVNMAGKIAMIFYAIMAGLIFFHIEVHSNAALEFGYKLAFLGGFLARIVSIPFYGYAVYKAQKELV